MLRTAVIGVGYLGKFHAEKYAALPDCQLVGVVDIDQNAGQAVADQYHAAYYSNHRHLLDKVDAVSVAVPTYDHYRISSDFLKAGIHVLVEKPITQTLQQAHDLVTLAENQQLVLQVGYLERFNKALSDVSPLLHNPQFIESHRLAGFKPRSMDINVVMDLMIHDLDIILSLVNEPIEHIAANGAAVLTNAIDIAQARLTFKGGCVANITASRISEKSKRKMHIFQDKLCICVDFQNLKMSQFYKGEGELYPGIPEIKSNTLCYSDRDSLRQEIEAFLNAIRSSRSPRVSGEDGYKSLAVAIQISDIIAGGERL